MPAFDVDQWVTDRPATPDRKLLVLDFWATWCGPCVAAIPHMNELATRFADIAQCVGVSDEQQSAFQQGLSRIGRSTRDFKYALALAPSRKLHTFFGIKGIPHCVVVSSDGIVRWQGHPMALTEEMFGRYAEAQKALNAAKPAPASKPDVNPPGGPRKY
jgi:thiol-disulfide isomerase/thioredoxin